MLLRCHLVRMVPALALLVGCHRGDAVPGTGGEHAAEVAAQQAHIREVVAAGGVVDSILPVAEHLRRFQATVSPVDTLRSASNGIPQLVSRLAEALATRDTAALNAMTVDRSEFAYLYYPESAMSRPPYEAPPELLWGQILASSNAGAGRLLERFAGTAVAADSLVCDTHTRDGDNILHERCTVRFAAPGRRTMQGNLFGTIIERAGRFKFLSLANRI